MKFPDDFSVQWPWTNIQVQTEFGGTGKGTCTSWEECSNHPCTNPFLDQYIGWGSLIWHISDVCRFYLPHYIINMNYFGEYNFACVDWP
jgi:hypothetical protein